MSGITIYLGWFFLAWVLFELLVALLAYPTSSFTIFIISKYFPGLDSSPLTTEDIYVLNIVVISVISAGILEYVFKLRSFLTIYINVLDGNEIYLVGWHLLVKSFYHTLQGFGLVLGACTSSFIIGVIKRLMTSFWRHEIGTLPSPILTIRRCCSLCFEAFREVKVHDWAMMYFAMTNIGCAILFYGYIYTEEGTFKPAWTEALG